MPRFNAAVCLGVFGALYQAVLIALLVKAAVPVDIEVYF